MSERLDNIMRNSYRGCIDDRKKIADIMKKIADLSLTELIHMLGREEGESIRNMVEALLNEEYGCSYEVNEELTDEIGVVELLCMADGTQLRTDEDETENSDLGLKSEWRTAFDYMFFPEGVFRYPCLDLFFYWLTEAKKANSLFRMFFAINVEAYMQPQSDCEADTSFAKMKEFFRRRLDFLHINTDPDTTIGEVFEQAEKIRKNSWGPGKSLEHYGKKILVTYEVCVNLVIDCFRYAYPRRFRLEDILDKYIYGG